jgi:histidyl-tRNA synthetase
VELAGIYHQVFSKLGLKGYRLHVNSRKILAALAEICGGQEQMTDITVAIDKLDKIGLEKVKEELQGRGLNEEQISLIEQYLLIDGSNEEKLAQIGALLGHIEMGKAGMEELYYLLRSGFLTPHCLLVVDFTLARGLNYYTGLIFEAKAPEEVKMGSIGGGGRYDDLTGLFGVPNIPGVGISFGLDRIYDVMEELQLFPEDIARGSQILFFNTGAEEARVSFHLLQALRERGIRGELFHESTKFDKQFKYAEKKKISHIVIIGSEELNNGTCVVKNLERGEQRSWNRDTFSAEWQPGL